jgi:hypothetical protein
MPSIWGVAHGGNPRREAPAAILPPGRGFERFSGAPSAAAPSKGWVSGRDAPRCKRWVMSRGSHPRSIERARLRSGSCRPSVPLLDEKFTGRPSFGVGRVDSSPSSCLVEESPHFVRVVHPDVVSCPSAARKGAPWAEGTRRRHVLRSPRPQMASPGRVAWGPWGIPRSTYAPLAIGCARLPLPGTNFTLEPDRGRTVDGQRGRLSFSARPRGVRDVVDGEGRIT